MMARELYSCRQYLVIGAKDAEAARAAVTPRQENLPSGVNVTNVKSKSFAQGYLVLVEAGQELSEEIFGKVEPPEPEPPTPAAPEPMPPDNGLAGGAGPKPPPTPAHGAAPEETLPVPKELREAELTVAKLRREARRKERQDKKDLDFGCLMFGIAGVIVLLLFLLVRGC